MNPSFGGRRVRGKKGRGAGGKTMAACIDSIIHSDGWRGYDGLVDRGYKKHFRVNHGQHEFARGNCPINGIESFCSYVKRRPAKSNGVPRKTFHLHLKKCEFRFNHREENYL